MRNRSQGCQPFPLVVLGFIDLKRYLCLLVTGAGGTAPNAAAHPFNAQGSAVLALSLQPADVPEVKLCVISIKATSPLWVRTSLLGRFPSGSKMLHTTCPLIYLGQETGFVSQTARDSPETHSSWTLLGPIPYLSQ